MNTIQVVCCADKDPSPSYLVRGWSAFKASLARFNVEPVVLGWNQPWRGLGSKPKLLKRAIEDGTVNADYILFLDSFDTVLIDSPEDILTTFLSLKPKMGNPRILWNAERNCFPATEILRNSHPEVNSPYRFFNSGMSIGDREAYFQILTEMKVDEWPDDYQKPDGSWVHVNDQLLFMEKFLFGQCADHEIKMALDSGCMIFQTMIGEELENFCMTFSADQRPIVLNPTVGQYPSAFHWNGPAKTAGTMEPILAHLGL